MEEGIIMEQKIKIIIADESEEMRASLRDYLSTLGAQVVCEAATQAELISGIKNYAPDIVLTDMWLGKSEAASTLKKVKALYENRDGAPDFIVFSACVSGLVFAEMIDAGAAYCMAKPIEYDLLSERIARLSRVRYGLPAKPASPKPRVKSAEEEVTSVLHKLGVSANIKGYAYLRTAILLTVEKPNEMSAVTKVLYPTVAKIYGTKPSCVERAMRHAISTAWERGDIASLGFYFGNTVKNRRGKPTNSEFIAMIADNMRLKYKIYK